MPHSAMTRSSLVFELLATLADNSSLIFLYE
jgi:hypothetical protein